MEANEELVFNLSATLFWDVDVKTIDNNKHASYIVERVLNMGTLEDFRLIKEFYGMPKIKRIIKKIRYMDDRLLNFCSIYFKISITNFRCYNTKQLNQSHWNY